MNFLLVPLVLTKLDFVHDLDIIRHLNHQLYKVLQFLTILNLTVEIIGKLRLFQSTYHSLIVTMVTLVLGPCKPGGKGV